MAYRRRQSLFP